MDLILSNLHLFKKHVYTSSLYYGFYFDPFGFLSRYTGITESGRTDFLDQTDKTAL